MKRVYIFALGVLFAIFLIAVSYSFGSEAALTNEDIVKLAKAGLGDEVIIAKINQTPKINFKLV